MDIVVTPGPALEGSVAVPGDKSIAHRWLILAATAAGRSRLVGLPSSLDVRSTAACLAAVTDKARPSLDVFARNASPGVEPGGSTWNEDSREPLDLPLEVEGQGRAGLIPPAETLDCGNSGTSMRLLSGVLAAAPFESVLAGDESLSGRPMDRVAEPLRAMGASIETHDGHAPLVVRGAQLRGIHHVARVPSAQVKSAVLFAGIAADGETTVAEPAQTRDHTERSLAALGAPVSIDEDGIHVARYQHGGFQARVPGDVSSAAFVIAAAAITGSRISIQDVGLNPTRLHFLEVMDRMGVRTTCTIERTELGEPVGSIAVEPCAGVRAVRVDPGELPLIIDEVPVLAALATHAASDSWFLEAAELRVKESDRLHAIATGVRDLGGVAADEGVDLVIAGGGLDGGRADARGDHRMAMALVVAALGGRGPSRIDGVEAADVSFPGFVGTMRALGVALEPA
jgi:3-phosphoshikimate 1-carboxyvinyltransferase